MAQSIALRITEAARTALLDFLCHCTPGAIVALELSETDGQFEIGEFSRERIPPSEGIAVSGVPFVFKENELAHFNGRTLDHRGGVFRVD